MAEAIDRIRSAVRITIGWLTRRAYLTATRQAMRTRATAGIALLLSAWNGQAQGRAALNGTVRETFSHVPLPAVSVQLIDSSGQARSTTITDSSGRYRIDAGAAGAYRVRATRLGYLPAESPLLRLDASAAVVADLTLARWVFLDSVLVVATSDAAKIRPTQQIIHGRLLDDDTGDPLSNGAMELRDSRDRAVASATTNQNGLFRFVTPSPGLYSVRGRRLGYQPAQQGDLRLSLGDTVLIDFRLSRTAVVLTPVVISGSAKPWSDRGDRPRIDQLNDRMSRFANQRRAQFILRDSIDAYDQRSRTTDKLLLDLVVAPPPRGPGCSGQSHVLDGLPFAKPEGFGGVDDFYPLKLIELIEVYTHPTIPSEFATSVVVPGARSPMMPPCRVISVWTRLREKGG